MQLEPVIGLEVHAELETKSKMFCACPVVDATQAAPNSAVCPICAGMPGVLPVINQRAVEYALRVALALECEIPSTSIFARKNYFYPDLPKGYQISQYEQPLAVRGKLHILTSQGDRVIRVRRVHLEEDTGKLTHIAEGGEVYSLVDLNRAGVPLLEIVSEPDLRTAEEVRAYSMALRSMLRYLGVNSGDMQKGVLRIEPNVSVRPSGSQEFRTRVEIKNLNSFKALERSVAFEIQRQTGLTKMGEQVTQETRGWDERLGETVQQRLKEGAEDYRYFPEPDLPPLVIETQWVSKIKAEMLELPYEKFRRFQSEYGLSAYDSRVLTAEWDVADFFENAVCTVPHVKAKIVANWITGELFALLKQADISISESKVSPQDLTKMVTMLEREDINQTTAKVVLTEMFSTGEDAATIVAERGLRLISDEEIIAEMVRVVLRENAAQVEVFLDGKETIQGWLFGQVMRAAGGKATPQVVKRNLEEQLERIKFERRDDTEKLNRC